MRFALKFILVCLLHATSAFAWDSANQKWFRDFSSQAPRFSNPYAASVWGSFQFPIPGESSHAYDPPVFENGYVTLETPLFRTGGFEAPLYLHPRPDSEDIAARGPLIILFSGIFESGKSPKSRHLAETFWRRGYHVAILPNPWSVSYIRRKPVGRPGNIPFEANIGLRFVHAAIQRLGAENITSVSLVGQSYGGLLSAAVFALDQLSDHPVINGSTLLISPPLNLRQSALNLDEGINRTESKYQTCGANSIFWNALRSLVFGEKTVQGDLSPKLLSCMEPILFRSFRNQLAVAVGAIRNALDVHFNDGDTDFVADEWKYTPRAEGMRFMRAFSEYIPGNLSLLTSPELRLAFWLNQLDSDSLEKVRIISAKDDFLNSGEEWPENECPAFGARNLFLLPWGGHLGFMGTPAFQEFLTLNYGKIR